MQLKKRSGFTILELLMTMLVLIAMMMIILVAYPQFQKKARDAVRKADLRSYASALENYASRSGGLYPIFTSQTGVATLCTSLGLGNCPNDPQNPANQYYYISNSTGTIWVLWVKLEATNFGSNNMWIQCYDGRSGRVNNYPANPLLYIFPSTNCPSNSNIYN